MQDSHKNLFRAPELQAGNPEISMAPLIDVVFLLLIFFMVTTVFPENRGLVITPPESQAAEQLAMKKMTFFVAANGEVEFKGSIINVADIRRIVTEQLAAAPDTAVLVQIDKAASTEVFVSVLDACKLAGAKQVGIATNAASATTAN
ncbi:MAG: biopolymer transporter ExbD [Gammaproteobacteria bacterium]|nr:biopolymer transporter ExbD [Gammaproteobacteria bacterium]